MTHALRLSSPGRSRWMSAAVWAVLGAVLLGTTLGIVLLAPSASGSPRAGVHPGGSFSCPSAPGNQTGVFITTNTTEGPVSLAVQFCSFSPQPVRASVWSFGDGNLSTSANTSHTYTVAGTFDVYLNVTFQGGGFGLAEVTILVTGPTNGTGPGGNGTGSGGGNGTGSGSGPCGGSGGGNGTGNSSSGLSVCAGADPSSAPADTMIHFWANASGGAPPYQFSWNFGNGGNGTGQWPGYAYGANGTYQAVVTVVDSTGAQGSASVIVTIAGSPSGGSGNGTGNSSTGLSVYAGAVPSTAPAPAMISFYANASGGTPPYTYFWTFGNGGNGTGESPSYVYTTPGTYSAVVYVYDSAGNHANATVTVTVTGNQSAGSALHLNFTASPDRGTAPLSVTFSAYVYGGLAPYTYRLCTSSGNCSSSTIDATTAYWQDSTTYLTPGNYTATATVVDATGNETISTVSIVVTAGNPLNVSVLSSSLSGPAPLAVGFLATVSGGTAPYSVEWAWGDGTVASSVSGAVVAHAYTTAGIFDPTLTVTDSAGHNLTVALGVVNVTTTPTVSAGKSSGFLPSGGSTVVVLEYLGIAAAGALISGVGVGLLLRRRGRQKDGASLVSALETNAGRDRPATVDRGSER